MVVFVAGRVNERAFGHVDFAVTVERAIWANRPPLAHEGVNIAKVNHANLAPAMPALRHGLDDVQLIAPGVVDYAFSLYPHALGETHAHHAGNAIENA